MPKRRDDRPHLDHEVLTQKQQAKFLGVKEETVMNLGHPVPVSKLAENPLGRPINYDSAPTQRIYRDPPKLQGVYRKCSDPVSGIASEQTLDKWADYAAKDSYRTGPGPGVEPPASDARRRSVPSEARSKDSDGYLASPKEWASYEYGSDSGLGRLEKAHKK